ncbi:MAG: exodeoxyribonuclease VII large subunit, partial [Alphaproteobacteria bacterium]
PNILQNRMLALGQSVEHLGQMLGSLSYKSVLARGYAIVRGADGNIISRTDAGTPATIEFTDGIKVL